MEKKLWFKKKKFGWGWAPANAAGWLVILIYLLGISAYPLLAEVGYVSFSVSLFLVMGFVLTAALIGICFKKGEKPSWNWGSDH